MVPRAYQKKLASWLRAWQVCKATMFHQRVSVHVPPDFSVHTRAAALMMVIVIAVVNKGMTSIRVTLTRIT